VKDAWGNLVTGYVGTVKLSSSDPLGVLPASYTFTAADAGVHVFSVTLKTAGSKSLTVTDAANAIVKGTTSITVTPAAAVTFLVTGFPTHPASGTQYSYTVTVVDAYGNTVTGYRGTVHLGSSDPNAVLPANYTFTSGDAGKHTFNADFRGVENNQP